MADIPQVLANYDALAGVVIGAGLTYGFGALNRRHQEKREDKTRWYQARLEAYTDVSRVVAAAVALVHNPDTGFKADEELCERLSGTIGVIRLVGSSEVTQLAGQILDLIIREVAKRPLEEGGEINAKGLGRLLSAFEVAARKDLVQSN